MQAEPPCGVGQQGSNGPKVVPLHQRPPQSSQDKDMAYKGFVDPVDVHLTPPLAKQKLASGEWQYGGFCRLSGVSAGIND